MGWMAWQHEDRQGARRDSAIDSSRAAELRRAALLVEVDALVRDFAARPEQIGHHVAQRIAATGWDNADVAACEARVAAIGGPELAARAFGRRSAPTPRERGILGSAFAGARQPLPFRGELERTYGEGLGHVEAHFGDDARAATASLGVEAFAVGHRIAFRSPNPRREVVAHEAAHTLQQRGVTAFPRDVPRSAPGGRFEREADFAAAAFLAGQSFRVASRTGGAILSAWYSHEHKRMGELGAEKALTNAECVEDGPEVHTTTTSVEDPLHEVNGRPAPQTRDVETITIETQEADPAGSGKVGSEGSDAAVTPGDEGDWTMGEASYMAGDSSPSVDRMAQTVSPATVGGAAEIPIVATNINHFAPLAAREWQEHHGRALGMALEAAKDGDPGKTNQALQLEGFALHFLQDTLASGHQYPGALDIYGGNQAAQGLSRRQPFHDVLCALPDGLPMKSAAKGAFRAGGDNFVRTDDYERGRDATAASLQEVLAALGVAPSPAVGAEAHLGAPDVPAILKDPVAGAIWRTMTGMVEDDVDTAQGKGDGQRERTAAGTSYGEREVGEEVGGDIVPSDDVMAANPNALASQPIENLRVVLEAFGSYLEADWKSQTYEVDPASGDNEVRAGGETKEDYFEQNFFFLEQTGVVDMVLRALVVVAVPELAGGGLPRASELTKQVQTLGADPVRAQAAHTYEALTDLAGCVSRVQPLGGHAIPSTPYEMPLLVYHVHHDKMLRVIAAA